MKAALWILGILLVVCGALLLAAGNSKARTARAGAYPALKKAYDHYTAYGEITNSAPAPIGRVFAFTNTVRVRETDYACVLAVQWEHFSCPTGTVVAITRDGKEAIWLEPGKPPRAIAVPRYLFTQPRR